MIICLDADGTIVDSLSVEAEYYVGAYRQMGIELVQNMDDLKVLCRDNYFEECAKHGIDEATCRQLGTIYRRDLARDGVKLNLFSGAAAVLNELGERFPLFIVSSNNSAFLAEILARHDVSGVLEIIGNDKEMSKVAAFHSIQNRYPGEKIVFAGDTKGDIIEGKKAGLDVVIGVTYGWGLKEDLTAASADVLVDSVNDLGVLLDHMEERL